MANRTAGIFICSLFLGIAAFLFFYARPLMFLEQTKREFRDSPEMWIVPKPLIPGSIVRAVAKPPTLSYFGYQFESPTAEVKEERKMEGVVVLSFSDCAVTAILRPQPGGSLAQITKAGPPGLHRSMENVVGKEAKGSDYALRRKVLNTTPGCLSVYALPSQMVRNSVLLRLKGIESQRFKNGLYSFETPSIRGFQEGDITLDKSVIIEAFDFQDRGLTLTVGRKPGKACFGQPELNQIIFSLRPAASSE